MMHVHQYILALTVVYVLASSFSSAKEFGNVTSEHQPNQTYSKNSTTPSSGGNFLTNAFDAMKKLFFCKLQLKISQ